MAGDSSSLIRQLRRVLFPASKLARSTVWLGILCVLFWTTDLLPGTDLGFWALLLTIAFLVCALICFYKWGYRQLLWRLRNRLIVTYLFIGVMPIALLLIMGAIASYLFAGQFATYVVTSDLQSELLHLQAANDALAAQLFPLEGAGKLNEPIAQQYTRASDERFPGRTVTVCRGDEGFVLATDGKRLGTRPEPVPSFIRGDFTGFVLDGNALHLRAIRLSREKEQTVALISDIGVTPNLLISTAKRLGSVTLLAGNEPVKAGEVSRRTHWFDITLHFPTLFDMVDWKTGFKQTPGLIYVATRPSMLYATLFATLGDRATIFRDLLGLVAIIFGLIELAALYVGVRLSRSMTSAVSELYQATEHVNRGDLSHRIQIRGHDQMAALESSFNSMTGSLARLIDEQKEKQRLESELTIAYEVQDLLFPHKVMDIPSLEVHGVCVPARTVSGDYYDFIPLGTDRLVLAVGDISGKGISAALLMATVHAYVRAYSLEPEMAMATPLREGHSQNYFRDVDSMDSQLAPAMLMTTLNYQLYRSTPAAKYATLFLGSYDPNARVLRYCNAGHLPPILVRASGETFPLEVNGTVVGLLEGASYDESTIVMQPGDMLVAYSDGVTEPENEFGEFGEDRLVALVREHQHKPLPRICEIITAAVADWIGAAEQPDDVTVVLARCTAPSHNKRSS
jgi:sigma-B regulation protein RsbU (phosphoserine phosphatase)